MNIQDIREKYVGDSGLYDTKTNPKYRTKENTDKFIERFKSKPSFGKNFVDTNFAIVDARDAMQKVIDIADKAGYGAVKTMAKKLKADIIALWNLHKKEAKMPNKQAV